MRSRDDNHFVLTLPGFLGFFCLVSPMVEDPDRLLTLHRCPCPFPPPLLPPLGAVSIVQRNEKIPFMRGGFESSLGPACPEVT